MKRRIAYVLALVMLVSVCAFFVQPVEAQATSGYCGNDLTWSIDGSGTFTISGTGPMWNYGWNVISGFPISDIRKIVVNEGVTSIGESAFSGCTNLTSVQLADSVTEIGYNAFYYCGQLQDISFGEGLKRIGGAAFSNCTSLTQVILPEGLTAIDMQAFAYCTALCTVSLPDSLSEIYQETFVGCNNLQYQEYDNAKYLGNDRNPYVMLVQAVDNSITSCNIHEDTRVIYAEAFRYCSQLETLSVPDSVIYVGTKAFADCNKLQFNTLDSVNYLGNGTNPYVVLHKAADTAITACEIPDGVNFISSFAFSGCADLATVTIPDSVVWIDRGAFYNCTSLTYVCIPDSVTTITGDLFNGCTSLTAVDLPAYATGIGSSAFYNCSSLVSIVIPEGVTELTSYAFANCTSLQLVVIPGTVVDFTYHVFDNCSSLWHVLYRGPVESPLHFADCGDIFNAKWHYDCVGDEVTDLANRLCALCCDHDFGETVEVLPTCTQQGYTGRTCSKCIYTVKENVVEATGHTFGQWSVATAATCEEDGEEIRSCHCGETETNVLPALGHNWDEGQVAKPPICVEDGQLLYTCSNCAGTRTEVLPQTGEHTWDEGQVTKAPTCAHDGEKTFTCSDCDAARTEVLPKTSEHTWDEGQVTKEPTCVEYGEMTYTCGVCNGTKTESIPMRQEHKFSGKWDTTCNDCELVREVPPDWGKIALIASAVVLVAAGVVVVVILRKKKK